MSDERILLDLEDRMWRANREGDGGFYADVLRDDAVVVSRYGTATKDQIVPGIQANHNPYLRTDLSDQRVIMVTADSALVTYRADVTTLIEGAEREFSVLATSVYARADGGWRSVFHQQSALDAR